MAPALAAAPVVVERRRGRLGKLSGERIENHRRNCGYLRRKGADEPDGAKLRGKAKTVMGTAQLSDDCLVALVEMETAGDVVFADGLGKAAVPCPLGIAPEARRHSHISRVLRGKIAESGRLQCCDCIICRNYLYPPRQLEEA